MFFFFFFDPFYSIGAKPYVGIYIQLLSTPGLSIVWWSARRLIIDGMNTTAKEYKKSK